MYLFNNKINKGFTIIESLVAISILVIAVTGPLALASKGLAYSNYVRDEITAFYLANEAMDVVRNLRDTYTRNANANADWIGEQISGGSVVGGGLSLCKTNGCYFDVWEEPASLTRSFDVMNPGAAGGVMPTDFTLYRLSCGTHGDYYGKDFVALKNNTWYSSDCAPVEPSKFSRKVIVTPFYSPASSPTPNEIKVDSIVEWFSAGVTKKIVISENLFNIQ